MSGQDVPYRSDLQGLRAIAVLIVVLEHANISLIPGGFIGVDVFFVLSGYLITGLLFREFGYNKYIEFLSFYARRLKRILPAMITMIIISSLAGFWLLSGVEAREQLISGPFAATWTSNLYFAFVRFDYFNEFANRDIFLHTWSLGVEEQFYLIWPCILVILFWIEKKLAPGNIESGKYNISISGLGLIFIASLISSIYWTINEPQLGFYLMPSRIWQLTLGAIIYISFENLLLNKDNEFTIDKEIIFKIILAFGLILIISSALALNRNIIYPGFWAVLPSFGAALIISSGYMLSKGKVSPLAHPILIWLGDRSYSLYLWHWPILALGFSLGFQKVFPKLCLLLLALLAAMGSFQLIELPFWKGKLSHVKPHRMILFSLLIMLTVTLALHHTWRHLPKRNTDFDLSNQWRIDIPVIYKMPCDAWYFHARVEPCEFGADGANKKAVFIGDSIGAQWFSFIPALFPKPDWRIIVLTKSSCPIIDEDVFYERIGKTYQVCTDWRNAALDEIDKLKPDVLIIGNAATYNFSETQWLEGSARILERVSKTAKKVLVIPGTPNLGFDGPGCVSRNIIRDHVNISACSMKGRLQQIDTITAYLSRAAQRFPNVHLLDLNDLVCPMGTCSAITMEGIVVFRDSQHLTDSFVTSRIPQIRKKLEKLSTE